MIGTFGTVLVKLNVLCLWGCFILEACNGLFKSNNYSWDACLKGVLEPVRTWRVVGTFFAGLKKLKHGFSRLLCTNTSKCALLLQWQAAILKPEYGDVCQRGREQLCNVPLWHEGSVGISKWAGQCRDQQPSYRQTGYKVDKQVCVYVGDQLTPRTHSLSECPVRPKMFIAEEVTCRRPRQVNRQTGDEWVNDRSQTVMKEDELRPCRIDVSIKNPHRRSALSSLLSSPLSSVRRLSVQSAWRALQGRDESAINPAASPVSETVNGINWCCGLAARLYIHINTVNTHLVCGWWAHFCRFKPREGKRLNAYVQYFNFSFS